MATQTVIVRAETHYDYGNGLVGLDIPVRELTNEERTMIASLFPNLTDRAYTLLAQEALLSALHTGPIPQEECVSPNVKRGKTTV